MNERPNTGIPKQHEDCWPIMVRVLPAPSTIESWRPIVDQHLKVRAALDRQRSHQPEPQTSAEGNDGEK